jgi:hypothetical protein
LRNIDQHPPRAGHRIRNGANARQSRVASSLNGAAN